MARSLQPDRVSLRAVPWRKLTGRVKRLDGGRARGRRRFASPDSFNINIYLNYKTLIPATYSAARLQLSGMMVTASAAGRRAQA